MELLGRAALSSLQSAQNRDGGWGYGGGASWTEPTVYALLVQAAAGLEGEGFARGLAWLERTQRPDGGWPPHPSVNQSTWVTALAVLVLWDRPGAADQEKAVRWLLQESGRESGYVHRLRRWLLGLPPEQDLRHEGWPWFPGAAAWVAPTALTILALGKVQRRRPAEQLRARLEMGREFLLARRCRDGGWNYGANRSLGYEADSYGETTGLALLALHGAEGLETSLNCAQRRLETCRSAEARSWLELGLRAHGRTPAQAAAPNCRNLLDTALWLLAQSAARGTNVFLSG